MRWLLAVALVFLQQVGTVTLVPDTGPAGTPFEVSGTGFVPGERVKLLWNGTNLGGTVRIADDGSFTAAAIVPPDAAAGPHTVGVQSRKGDAAVATFQVMPPSTTTSTTIPASTTTMDTVAPPTTAAVPSTTVAGAGTAPTQGEPGTTTTVGAVPGVTTLPQSPAPDDPATTTVPTRAGSDETRPVSSVLQVALVWSVALAGGVVYLRRGRRQTSEEPATAGAVSPIPDPPPPPVLVDGRDGPWTRLAFDPTPPGRIAGLVDVPGGWLAVGTSTGGETPEAAVWRSPDGQAWTPGSALGPGSALAVLRRPSGYLAVGSSDAGAGSVAGCWVSDDGTTWTTAVEPSDPHLAGVVFEGVAGGDDVVVAFGRGPAGPGAWVGRPGENWEPASLPSGIELVAATTAGFVAFGRRADERSPILASSADGMTWSIHTEELFTFDGAAVLAVAGFDGGLVAAGLDLMRNTAAVWVSDDGVRWLRAPLDPGEGTSITHLTVLGDRLVAIGADSGTRGSRRPPSIAVWESRDAVTWDRLEEGTTMLTGATVSAVGVADGTMVLAGTLVPSGGVGAAPPIPAVWTRDLHPAAVAGGTGRAGDPGSPAVAAPGGGH